MNKATVLVLALILSAPAFAARPPAEFPSSIYDLQQGAILKLPYAMLYGRVSASSTLVVPMAIDSAGRVVLSPSSTSTTTMTANLASLSAHLDASGTVAHADALAGIAAIGSSTAALNSGNLATIATGITYSASLYGSITNTCYMQSWTTTVTGFAGWIDCRGASQLVFTVQVAGKADHVAHAGSGVSMFVDSSGELAVNLPTTAVDSAWNNTLSPSPGFYMAASTVTIDNPAAAVRLRWHIGSTGNVGYGPTATVMYTLKFPGKGPNGTEAGPTPPMH